MGLRETVFHWEVRLLSETQLFFLSQSNAVSVKSIFRAYIYDLTTLSAIFNRSMRALAIKKGMSLSEHALKTDVIRGGDRSRAYEGTSLPTPDEESVFKHLGIPYRIPEEREHGK